MDAVMYGYMAASNQAQTMTNTVKRTPGIITLGDNKLVIKSSRHHSLILFKQKGWVNRNWAINGE
jgi:hypothetical protein